MAGTVTITSMSNEVADGRNEIVIDWLSDASGDATGDIASLFSATQAEYARATPSKIKGRITKVLVSPGLLGDRSTTCPATIYTLTLKDEYAHEIIGNNLADLSTSLAQSYVPATPIPVDSEISFAIASAGNAKKGRVIIYLEAL